MTKYYKFLSERLVTGYAWFAHPDIGEWTEPVEGELELCENGYHVATRDNCIFWLNARMFEVEVDDVVDDRDKSVCRRERLIREIKVDKQVFVDIANEAAQIAEEYAEAARYATHATDATAAAYYAAIAAAHAAHAALHVEYDKVVKQLSNKFIDMVGE